MTNDDGLGHFFLLIAGINRQKFYHGLLLLETFSDKFK